MKKMYFILALFFPFLIYFLIETWFGAYSPKNLSVFGHGQVWKHRAQKHFLSGKWSQLKNNDKILNVEQLPPLDIDKKYRGIEVDVMWDAVSEQLIVSHDVEEKPKYIEVYQLEKVGEQVGEKVSLQVFLSVLPKELPLWIDLKTSENINGVIDELKRLEIRDRVLIESRQLQAVLKLREAGFMASWWISIYFNLRKSLLGDSPQRKDYIKAPYRLFFNLKRLLADQWQKIQILRHGIEIISMPYENYLYIENDYRNLNVLVWVSSETSHEIIDQLKTRKEIKVILD